MKQMKSSNLRCDSITPDLRHDIYNIIQDIYEMVINDFLILFLDNRDVITDSVFNKYIHILEEE